MIDTFSFFLSLFFFWGCDKSLMLLHDAFDSYLAPRDQSVVGSGLTIVKLSAMKTILINPPPPNPNDRCLSFILSRLFHVVPLHLYFSLGSEDIFMCVFQYILIDCGCFLFKRSVNCKEFGTKIP